MKGNYWFKFFGLLLILEAAWFIYSDTLSYGNRGWGLGLLSHIVMMLSQVLLFLVIWKTQRISARRKQK